MVGLESIKIGDNLYDIRHGNIMTVTVRSMNVYRNSNVIAYEFNVCREGSDSISDSYTDINFKNHEVFRSYDEALQYAVMIPEDENTVKFNITCTMKKRWVNQFCSFLKQMERNGNIGHSEILSFMSDGDGDFRPTFDIRCEFEKEENTRVTDKSERRLYDAG